MSDLHARKRQLWRDTDFRPLQIGDQLAQPVGIVPDVTQREIAVGAEPSPEAAALVAMVEMNAAFVVATDITASRFGPKRLGLLDRLPTMADEKPLFVLLVLSPIFRATPFFVLLIRTPDSFTTANIFRRVGKSFGSGDFAAQAAAGSGCSSEQRIGADFLLRAAIAEAVPPDIARLGIGVAAAGDEQSGEPLSGEFVSSGMPCHNRSV